MDWYSKNISWRWKKMNDDMIDCPACGGFGFTGDDDSTCKQCDGIGEIER